jgi:hypothetical protein
VWGLTGLCLTNGPDSFLIKPRAHFFSGLEERNDFLCDLHFSAGLGPNREHSEAVGAALLALATLRLWDLHEYVNEVGLQPGHLTRHPVLTGGELQDDLLQSRQTAG